MSQAVTVLQKLYSDYQKTTPQKLKIIDAYMFYILLTGIAQVFISFCASIFFSVCLLCSCWNIPIQLLPFWIYLYCYVICSRL